MPLSDHYKGSQSERLIVSIVTVDSNVGRIECVGKDAAIIQIGVSPVPTLFRWPKEGEHWIVERENGLWRLDSIVESPNSNTRTKTVAPGEALLQAETMWTPSGERFLTTADTGGGIGVASYIPMEAWHYVGAAGEPAFQNSWANYGAPYGSARFRRFPDGRIQLAGSIKTGTTGTVAFTLPVGYRPSASITVPIIVSGGNGYVLIGADGTVQIIQLTGTASVRSSFDTVEFQLDSVNEWPIGGGAGDGGTPIGSVTAFSGDTIPTGWVLADGAEYSQTLYPEAYVAMGVKYGAAAAGMFKVPDLRNKFIYGKLAEALGTGGGATTHTLTIAQMPSHNHGGGNHNHSENAAWGGVTGPDGSWRALGDATGDFAANYGTQYSGTIINTEGSGQSHNNMPPYVILAHIVKISESSSNATAAGPAGGVLSGTYPNPGFAVDMTTQAELDTHNADITNVHGITDTSLIIVEGDIRLTNARIPLTHTHVIADVTGLSALLPTAGQKDALQGTSGTPSNTNRYVTDADSRLPGPSDIAVLKEAPLNIHQSEYASLATGDDWTAAFLAIKAALPASGGEILVPYRAPGYICTQEISIGKGHHWRGVGGGRNANTSTEPLASTQIRFTNNGRGFYVDSAVGSGWGLQGFLLVGDLALTSQDLLTIGTGSGTFAGAIRDVTCDTAGRDGVVLDFALNCLLERVTARACGRHGFRFTNQANANTLDRCYAGLNKQWGVYYQGGRDNRLNMTIESNSQAVGTDYGGLRVVGDTWNCQLHLDSCHFELNDGDLNTGVPVRVDVPTYVPTVVTEVGTEYGEVNPLTLNGGTFTSVGITTVMQPIHAIIGALHEGATFINPRRWGTGASSNGAGSFGLTDNSGKSIVIGHGHSDARPGLMVGGDTGLTRDAAGVWRVTDGGRIKIESAGTNGLFDVRRAGESNTRFTVDRDGALVWGGGSGATDTALVRDGVAGGNGLTLSNGDHLVFGTSTSTGSYIAGFEQTADPAAPAADGWRLYAKDNGAGKTQLGVLFATGGFVPFATQP